MLIAILPADLNDVPDVVTPEYVATQPLVLEHERGAVHALAMQWLSSQLPLERATMHIGTIEAVKTLVASGMGMSIVPDLAVSAESSDIVVRPLRPRIPCTLGLIEQLTRPTNPALDIVREALLGLQVPFNGSAGVF